MDVAHIRSLDEFLALADRDAENLAAHMREIESYIPADHGAFTIPGFSYTADKHVDFSVDFAHSDGVHVNWRERVNCPITAFNNRMRATIHLIDLEGGLGAKSTVYITEQVTTMYKYLKRKFPKLIGSEFLGDDATPGKVRRDGIRHEDLTRLSLPDNSQDAIISLDVIEHVPAFTEAFAECHRTLKPGGRLIWSVPFIDRGAANSIRARVTPDGIEHLFEPEYHGNPMSEGGSLCYTHFGWEMLNDVKAVGFKDAWAASFYSLEFGYLGGYQHLFFAIK